MSQPVRIKICGITNEEDARLAGEVGADAVGLNFYPGSPRCLDPARAKSILGELPPFVTPVALFVNQSILDASRLLHQVGSISILQIHGALKPVTDPFPLKIISAFQVRDRGSLEEINQYLDACREQRWRPCAILVDACVPGHYGGTGHTAPWEMLADYRPPVPLILAGGLTPENVAAAIRNVRPFAVDVASGVESSPGRKDPDKLRRFIDNARSA